MTDIDALAINAAKQQKSLDKSLINPGGGVNPSEWTMS